MKKQYKALICVIVLEFVLLLVLDQSMLVVRSWIGNAVGTFIFLLPIQIRKGIMISTNLANVCQGVSGIKSSIDRRP